jgi:hypothetical protein
MDMVMVISSAIRSIGHDPSSLNMMIKFKQGKSSLFRRVPRYVYDSFLGARSKGTFYDRHIKGHYQS